MSKLMEKDDQGNWSLKGVAWKELYVGQVITRELHERILWGALEADGVRRYRFKSRRGREG